MTKLINYWNKLCLSQHKKKTLHIKNTNKNIQDNWMDDGSINYMN